MASLEPGKHYRVVVALTYDIFEAKVTCVKELAKSYRVMEKGELYLIKKCNLVEAEELATI